ncbi:MAG: hypothetical protein QOH06_4249 [Acidobacteriota bacterium]|jgi:Cdc6-like AAA superfamily ATPase|nr:hypothetical protein [Acidobacteriota bacterium]
MLDIQEWLRDHKPLWKTRQARAEENLVPRPLFGEEDAATEWSHNSNPQQVFAHIASYEEFISYGALFLFGRRGTGKTALLHMVAHDINSGGANSKNYSCAVLLQPVLVDALSVFRGARLSELKETDLLSLMRVLWHWLIVSASYIETIRRSPNIRLQNSDLADKFHKALETDLISHDLASYLLGELLLIFKSILKEIPDGANQLALTTIALREQLGTFSIRPLEIHIAEFQRKHKKPILVLVETEEVYQIDDLFASAMRSALIDSLIEIYKHYQQLGFLAKAAFPSEIYPFIEPSNVEKLENKIVFIIWRYRDLVTLVAKRYYRLIHGDERQGKLEKGLDSLDDYSNAKKFLDGVLPSRIATRNSIELDTFSYILRHTQKKPRQLIAIFNCILTMADDRNLEFSDLADEVELVRDAVHSRLDTLVVGALDIYRGIYPRATEIVRKTMTGMSCYFTASDLDKAIKQTNELRNEVIGREHVRQLLVQAGVIGLTRDVPNTFQRSEPTASIMEALFEYQVKGKLVVTNNSICVVHPMFYEELQIRIDSSVLAYPKPSEEEEELLRSYGWLRL